jgi:hypothetical protein
MSLWSGAESKAGAIVHFKTCKFLGSRKILHEKSVEITKELLPTYIKQTYTFKNESNNPFERTKKQPEILG